MFRSGTPDLQPMKPWVVFGTGGDGRTWNGKAWGLATWGHRDMRLVHGGLRIIVGGLMGKRQERKYP